jgi:hypothetical protein
MRSAHVLAVRAALLGLVLAGTGCFRPKIPPGAFMCGEGGAGICPDGQICDHRNNTCVQTISDAGVGGTTGTGGMGKGGQSGQGGKGGAAGKDGGPPDMQPDAPVTCLPAVANTDCPVADAGTGMCDPVCNTGCAQCNEKCSVNTSGNLTCNVPTTTRTPGLLAPCDPSSFGASQTDDCQPGQVCVNANSCGARCYQFCRSNADCTGGASCSRDAGGGLSTCDVPQVACDPVNGAAKSSCGGGVLVGCYLSATTSNTLCDCQNNRSDGMTGTVRDLCTKSRDCFAGLVCYDALGQGTKQCWKVCRLPKDGGVDAGPGEVGCIVASSCSPILLPNGTNNPTYGFCNE